MGNMVKGSQWNTGHGLGCARTVSCHSLNANNITVGAYIQLGDFMAAVLKEYSAVVQDIQVPARLDPCLHRYLHKTLPRAALI